MASDVKGHEAKTQGEGPAVAAVPTPKLFGSALAYKLVRFSLIGLLLVGVGIMLIPFAQRVKFSIESVTAADEYQAAVDELDEAMVEAQWILAQEYNRARAYNRSHGTNTIIDPFRDDIVTMEVNAEYWSLVNPLGNGMMGYIDIPKIGERLPIYHGTDNDVLAMGVGHLQGTSLPVGGASTHCVLSGHRGLAEAKIFTDLDQMEVGDVVSLHVLNHDMSYEVDKIDVCLPEEISLIDIVAGEDLLTLVTCTPYAVNTHRLLVRGHAVPYVETSMPETTALRFAGQNGVWLVIAATAFVLVVLLVAWRRGKASRKAETSKSA